MYYACLGDHVYLQFMIDLAKFPQLARFTSCNKLVANQGNRTQSALLFTNIY